VPARLAVRSELVADLSGEPQTVDEGAVLIAEGGRGTGAEVMAYGGAGWRALAHDDGSADEGKGKGRG
jgi:hypothetical protein